MASEKLKQVLLKRQTRRGTAAAVAAADAVLCYDVEVEDLGEPQEVQFAGPSQSSDFVPMGLEQRQITFRSDFKGSGDTSAPYDEPEWGKAITACGYRRLTFADVPVTGITGTGFQPGEKVSKDANNYGVCLERVTANGTVRVAPVKGTITSTGTLTGASSGTTATIGVAADSGQSAYAPASVSTVTVTCNAWATATPVAGMLAVVTRSGNVVGVLRILADNGGTMVSFVAELLYGDVLSGDGLTSTAGGTTTTTADAVLAQVIPATIRANRAGFARETLDAIGSFELAGNAGERMVFSFSFQGAKGIHADALPADTGALVQTAAPRLLGAVAGFGFASGWYQLPVAEIAFQAGGNVVQALNVNAASGSDGGEQVERAPELRVVVRQTGSIPDWLNIRSNALPVRFGVRLGTAAGNVVGMVVPNAQLVSVRDTSINGLAAMELVLRPRRQLEAGDDEVYLFAR